MRIEGTNSYHSVFRCAEAVVHHAAPTRGACVVHEIVDGHRPAVWLSDRYAARQGHADRQQSCLAHLARDVAYALDASDDTLACSSSCGSKELSPWHGPSPPRRLDGGHQAPKAQAFPRGHPRHPATCDLARNRIRRARDQLLTFASCPGQVEAHNSACARDLRPAVIPRKNTNIYRAMWGAKGEAAVRTVVATVRITSGADTFSTVLRTIGA